MSTPVAPIARSLLTGELVDHLIGELGSGILVGRGVAPAGAGWVGGQPGMSEFKAYTVVKTGKAGLLESDPIGRNRMSWKCNYQLTSSGGNEEHADDVADWVRAAVVSLPTTFTLRGVEWVLQKIDVPELGNTVSSSAVDPPFWNVTDAVSLWLSRTRGQ
jgi:hypothetical protein